MILDRFVARLSWAWSTAVDVVAAGLATPHRSGARIDVMLVEMGEGPPHLCLRGDERDDAHRAVAGGAAASGSRSRTA